MKKNLKKWFNKKDKTETSEDTTTPQENYTAMSSNSLYTLPPAELVSIIFKFDLEVKNLNKDLLSTKEQLSTIKQDFTKSQEQNLLYKQHNESLQSECNRLALNLNQTTTLLDSKQEQIEVITNQLISRDEISNSYKSKIQELEKQVTELQLTGIKFDAGEEIVKLKAKIEESSKSSAEINELKIKNKMLEGEINKLSANIIENKEQIRMWRDKINIFENDRKDTDTELNKKKAECESLNNQINKLNFLKESSDTEIRALKESSNQKDIKLAKKLAKIECLQEQNLELQQKASVLKFELDSSKAKQQEEINYLKEKFILEKESFEGIFNEKILNLEQEIQELNIYKTNSSILESVIKNQQDTLSNTLIELHQKTLKINSLELENGKIANELNTSEKKRELANNEIMKLTQRLSSIESSMPGIRINSEPEAAQKKTYSPKELDLLQLVKNELEEIYKTLMKIIGDCDSVFYQIKIEDFSRFEKKLNKHSKKIRIYCTVYSFFIQKDQV